MMLDCSQPVNEASHSGKRRLDMSPILLASGTVTPETHSQNRHTGHSFMEPSSPNPDPKYHTRRIKQMLDDLIEHLREDTSHITEPKAQALFETSAEVLRGLQTAFTDYERGRERAMRT